MSTRSSRPWSRLRARVLAASTVCHICGRDGADQVDHLVPLAAGGTDDIANLAPAHRACNRAKSDRPYAPVVRRSGALQ